MEPKTQFQNLRGNECVRNKHLLSFREIAKKNTHVYLKRLFKHSKLLKMLRFPLTLPPTRRATLRQMPKVHSHMSILTPDYRGFSREESFFIKIQCTLKSFINVTYVIM